MPMDRFIREAAFDPATISILVAAYEAALQRLPSTDRSAVVDERIARKLIEIIRFGEEDPLKLRDQALGALGLPTVSSVSQKRRIAVTSDTTNRELLANAILISALVDRAKAADPEFDEVVMAKFATFSKDRAASERARELLDSVQSRLKEYLEHTADAITLRHAMSGNRGWRRRIFKWLRSG